MSRIKIHALNSLIGALAFGLGFLFGLFLAFLLFRYNLLNPALELITAGRLYLGIALVLLFVGLAGAIGGAIGSVALAYMGQTSNRSGYAWRAALAFGLSYALILLPLTLTLALIAFYELAESSPIMLMIPLGIIGAIFGAVSGLIFGLLTVKWESWRVLLAGAIGFALGGAGFGYGLWGFFFGPPGVQTGNWTLFAGFFAFGAFGGGALGFGYSWLTHRVAKPSLYRRLAAWYKRAPTGPRLIAVAGLILLILILRGLWLISPFAAAAAPLQSVLESKTIGTHWSAPTQLADKPAGSPAIFAAANGQVAVAWSDGRDITFVTRSGVDQDWAAPVNVSDTVLTESTNPQIVLDRDGGVHLVWTEAVDKSGAAAIHYSRCRNSTCTPPVELSKLAGLSCLAAPATPNEQPAIAIDAADTLLVTWRNGQQALPFSAWPAAEMPPELPTGCIPTGETTTADIIEQPRLASAGPDSFSLTFARTGDQPAGEIYLSHYTAGSWEAAPQLLGQGNTPEIFAGQSGQIQVAWCNAEQQLNLWSATAPVEQLTFPHCLGRPGLISADDDLPRLIWSANEVENSSGVVKANALLYESVKSSAGWSPPTIIAQTGDPTQLAAAAASDGTLHLVWVDPTAGQSALQYAWRQEYDCNEAELSDIGQTILNVVSQEKYRPASDLIPFCGNRYDRLIFAPEPDPTFSQESPTPNGPFDQFAELIKSTQYEVDFSTMWYDKDKQQDSPGFVVAQAVVDLYQQLKAQPERYPRGLTVRILLGNPPSFALFPTFNNQVRLVLDDLRAAGLPEMQNPELGWNLEVANFKGSWPHSHTKMMIVDGKTAIAAGYNFQYAHYPIEHPSGQGKDKVDVGLQVTGPVVQDTLLAFDDLWAASTRVYCTNINPNSRLLWMLSCQVESATIDHGPEVLHYYLPESNSNAFSLPRTQKFQLADEAYHRALASAKSSIDTIQVNFSLEAICDLGVLLQVCNFANRINPLDALMTAVETNQAQLRILVKEAPIDGYENQIAISAFQNALADRGLSDLVEIRYFNGKYVHPKAALIDQELLVVGSQNYHYSAWGDRALTEYSLAVEDPAAIADFQKFFDYEWARAIPVE